MSSVQFIQDITINFDLEKLEYLSIQNTNMVLNNVSSLNKLINLKVIILHLITLYIYIYIYIYFLLNYLIRYKLCINYTDLFMLPTNISKFQL